MDRRKGEKKETSGVHREGMRGVKRRENRGKERDGRDEIRRG